MFGQMQKLKVTADIALTCRGGNPLGSSNVQRL